MSLPEHMSKVSKLQTMCVSCSSLVQPRFIPLPFFVLLAELLEAQSEALQLTLLLCQNFEGCHLKGCFAERLETCVPATNELSLPWRKLGALCPDLGH